MKAIGAWLRNRAMWGRLSACGPIVNGPKILFRLLGELSEQNAYKRYLKMNGVTHSREEWRRFMDALYRRKYHQTKCC